MVPDWTITCSEVRTLNGLYRVDNWNTFALLQFNTYHGLARTAISILELHFWEVVWPDLAMAWGGLQTQKNPVNKITGGWSVDFGSRFSHTNQSKWKSVLWPITICPEQVISRQWGKSGTRQNLAECCHLVMDTECKFGVLAENTCVMEVTLGAWWQWWANLFHIGSLVI